MRGNGVNEEPIYDTRFLNNYLRTRYYYQEQGSYRYPYVEVHYIVRKQL